MINSNSISKILTNIIQPNIKIILLLSVIFILLIQYVDNKIIIACGLIFTIMINYGDILKTFETIQKNESKNEKVIENNKRTKKEIYFDEDLDKIIKKLHKYRKYNQNSHDEGYKYIKMFSYIIHDLERDDISHPRQYFENAELYLTKSLNNYQSISISVPEENFNNALKYNKFESTKLGNRIGKLCKKLHKHCFYLLFNLSKRFNKDWIENPDIYKNEITINHQDVKPVHSLNFNWDYY